MARIILTGGLTVGAVAQGTARRVGSPVGGVPVFAGISVGTSRYGTADRRSAGFPAACLGKIAEACIILTRYGVGASLRGAGGSGAAVARPIVPYRFIGAGSIRAGGRRDTVASPISSDRAVGTHFTAAGIPIFTRQGTFYGASSAVEISMAGASACIFKVYDIIRLAPVCGEIFIYALLGAVLGAVIRAVLRIGLACGRNCNFRTGGPFYTRTQTVAGFLAGSILTAASSAELSGGRYHTIQRRGAGSAPCAGNVFAFGKIAVNATGLNATSSYAVAAVGAFPLRFRFRAGAEFIIAFAPLAVCLTGFAYAPQTAVRGNFAGAAGKVSRAFARAGNKPFAGSPVAGYRSGLNTHILTVAASRSAADAGGRTRGSGALARVGFGAAGFFAGIFVDASGPRTRYPLPGGSVAGYASGSYAFKRGSVFTISTAGSVYRGGAFGFFTGLVDTFAPVAPMVGATFQTFLHLDAAVSAGLGYHAALNTSAVSRDTGARRTQTFIKRAADYGRSGNI